MCSPIACHYLSQALQIYNPVLWHCVHLCVCSSFAQLSVHVMYAVFVLLCLNQCLSFTQLSPIFILLLDDKLSVPTVHFCMHAPNISVTSALKIGKGDVEKNIFLFLNIFFSKPFIITLWNDCYIFSWLFLKNEMIRRMCVCCVLFTGRIISLLPERKWLLLSEGTSIFCKQSY